MSSSHTQIKTNAMQKFLRTYGGMVPEGEYPSEELIEVFENFDSPESMFAWIAARWRAGGFDKPPKTTTTTKVKKDPNKKGGHKKKKNRTKKLKINKNLRSKKIKRNKKTRKKNKYI